jgi:hypothetical protein
MGVTGGRVVVVVVVVVVEVLVVGTVLDEEVPTVTSDAAAPRPDGDPEHPLRAVAPISTSASAASRPRRGIARTGRASHVAPVPQGRLHPRSGPPMRRQVRRVRYSEEPAGWRDCSRRPTSGSSVTASARAMASPVPARRREGPVTA